MGYDSSYHAPVLVEEVSRYLQPGRGGAYLDGTLGGGGHAQALLDGGAERLIGVDRDPEALAAAGARLAGYGKRVGLVRASYADATEAAGIGTGTLSGALLDLGISSRQIDVDDRGFTFRPGAPLDMRMGGEMEGIETAADLLNTRSEFELAEIFYRFGEERRSRRLARVVAEMRESRPFALSEDLVAAIERVIPRATVQDRARIFQALRIAVNAEMEALGRGLPLLRDALASGGVLAVLSYHSLEDRMVKDSFREWSRACVCPPAMPVCTCRGEPLGELLTRKPVMAGAAELEANPRSRSARLRAWRRA
jgi:16S rRNA (cytosine1402-N4)-methyltransferase